MRLLEYFNPDNEHHMLAVQHLLNKWRWPSWFIAGASGQLDVRFTDTIIILYRLAKNKFFTRKTSQ